MLFLFVEPSKIVKNDFWRTMPLSNNALSEYLLSLLKNDDILTKIHHDGEAYANVL